MWRRSVIRPTRTAPHVALATILVFVVFGATPAVASHPPVDPARLLQTTRTAPDYLGVADLGAVSRTTHARFRLFLRASIGLTGAIAGQGSLAEAGQGSEASAFTFTYGRADELLTTQDPALGTTTWQNGPLGRPTGRTWTGGSAGSGSGTIGPGSETITYDALGRRIEDARFTYIWDWRGRLLRLTVKDPQPDGPGATSAAAFAGHQLRYGYDALGRLTDRTHLGVVPSGGGDDDRPFIDRRRFLWDGDTLLTELGINFEGAALWRATHLPGPTGLDDAPLVRIERISPAGADSLVTILRDELGTTEAILSGEDLLGRILATPYGDTALERGPEPRHIRFDATRTQADSQSQTPTSGHIPGALILATSLPLDGATLAAGVHLQRWDGQWLDLGPTAIELEGSDLIVLPLQGWPSDTSCRLVLDATITDAFTRAVRSPDTGATGFDVALDVPASGSPTFERSWSAFDTIRTASSTLDGALPGGVTSLFHGMWTDPVSGIAYARARWYDPSRGMWLAEDPIGAVDSPNLYAYVGWQPHMGRDPMGLYKLRTVMDGGLMRHAEVVPVTAGVQAIYAASALVPYGFGCRVADAIVPGRWTNYPGLGDPMSNDEGFDLALDAVTLGIGTKIKGTIEVVHGAKSGLNKRLRSQAEEEMGRLGRGVNAVEFAGYSKDLIQAYRSLGQTDRDDVIISAMHILEPDTEIKWEKAWAFDGVFPVPSSVRTLDLTPTGWFDMKATELAKELGDRKESLERLTHVFEVVYPAYLKIAARLDEIESLSEPERAAKGRLSDRLREELSLFSLQYGAELNAITRAMAGQ